MVDGLREAFKDKGSGQFQPLQAQLVASLLSLAATLMTTSDEIKLEFLRTIRIEDIFLIVIREQEPDILCAEAATRGLRVLLESLKADEGAQGNDADRELMRYILQSLMDMQPSLLQKLSMKTLPGHLRSLQRHVEREKLIGWETTSAISSHTVSVPQAVFDNRIHSYYANLIKILYFLRTANNVSSAIVLDQHFRQQSYASTVLQCCHFPSDIVRSSAFELLALLPVESFQREELEELLNLAKVMFTIQYGENV